MRIISQSHTEVQNINFRINRIDNYFKIWAIQNYIRSSIRLTYH